MDKYTIQDLLRGAYDLHVHAAPDMVPRVGDFLELSKAAADAGMAGIGLKTHLGSTAQAAHAVNTLYGGRFVAFGAICLNPPVGGINPCAVEAALAEGARIVYFPTYASRAQIAASGGARGPLPFPQGQSPLGILEGVRVFGSGVSPLPETSAVLELIAQHDGVLATGHLSSAEALLLVEAAARAGVRRILMTHVSESVPGMDIPSQMEAIGAGAFIEHSFLPTSGALSQTVPMESIAADIRKVGVERVILSSDYGRTGLPPPVEGFAQGLGKLADLGFSFGELRTMIHENPRRLLG